MQKIDGVEYTFYAQYWPQSVPGDYQWLYFEEQYMNFTIIGERNTQKQTCFSRFPIHLIFLR